MEEKTIHADIKNKQSRYVLDSGITPAMLEGEGLFSFQRSADGLRRYELWRPVETHVFNLGLAAMALETADKFGERNLQSVHAIGGLFGREMRIAEKKFESPSGLVIRLSKEVHEDERMLQVFYNSKEVLMAWVLENNTKLFIQNVELDVEWERALAVEYYRLTGTDMTTYTFKDWIMNFSPPGYYPNQQQLELELEYFKKMQDAVNDEKRGSVFSTLRAES